MTKGHNVFHTKLEDGTFLAASFDSPRFCVGAPTLDEALAKADRAFSYYHSISTKDRSHKPLETRVITPFFQLREMECA